jgi:hypothetical protein
MVLLHWYYDESRDKLGLSDVRELFFKGIQSAFLEFSVRYQRRSSHNKWKNQIS